MRTMILPVALLAACADATDPWPASPAESALSAGEVVDPLPAPPPSADLVLEVSDLVPGQRATLSVTNADPGETVFFLRNTAGLGQPGLCPGPLGGNCLDLVGPVTVAGTATANANGMAQLSFTLPATVPNGLAAYFEAAAVRAGADSVTSNPVAKQIGQVTPYSASIVVDGDGADWTVDQAFDTTSGVGQTWVSWDATNLYVGLQHPDIATGGPEHWSVIYLATDGGGTSTGITHNTQAPALPFDASVAIRRKADGSYDSLLEWDGAAWVETAYWLGTEGSAAAEGGDLLELAIPRALLGADRVRMATSFVFEGNGFESTFAGTPTDSFVDGYDPDLGSFLDFDMASPSSPVAQNP